MVGDKINICGALSVGCLGGSVRYVTKVFALSYLTLFVAFTYAKKKKSVTANHFATHCAVKSVVFGTYFLFVYKNKQINHIRKIVTQILLLDI